MLLLSFFLMQSRTHGFADSQVPSGGIKTDGWQFRTLILLRKEEKRGNGGGNVESSRNLWYNLPTTTVNRGGDVGAHYIF